MRVSDRSTARNYLKYLNTAKGNYAKTNQQIASQQRFSWISEDVSAGTRAMRSRMEMYKAEKNLDNVQAISDELGVAEGAMMNMSEILARAKETLLKASSEDKGEAGRKAVADELKSLKQEMVQLANTRFSGKFSFGGSNASMSAPFSVGDDGYIQYNGIPVNDIMKDADGYYYNDANGDRQSIPMDEDVYMDIGMGIAVNQSRLDSNSGFKISISGLDILGFGKTDDGLPNNVYNILADLEKNLRTYDEDAVGKLSKQLEAQTDVFGSNLTEVGAKTSLLESMEDRLKSQVDSHKNRIQNLVGIKDEEMAVTQMMNDYVLKAVIQMGSNILPLSLMDFLR